MRDPEKQTVMEMTALLHDQPFSRSSDIFKDVKTFTRRARNEGFHFLTNVLPQVAKAIDASLSGNVALDIGAILKTAFNTRIPHFLGSALRKVFDSAGMLLEQPCYITVTWLRSFLLYSYKIEVPYDDDKLSEYSSAFVATDSAIGEFPFCGDSSTRVLRGLMRRQLESLYSDKSSPAFGPGISSNCQRTEKYVQYVPPSQLRTRFGRNFFHQPDEHAHLERVLFYVGSFFDSFLSGVKVDRCAVGANFAPSKVLFVPKDSRGPRTICCEDSRLMFAQKSLQKSLYSQIERSSDMGGQVNFTDQTINQRLTFDKSYATLDLKDASDRVSLDLVIDVFPTKLCNDMISCRSPRAVLPTGDIITLQKFAPMGSALCFPVMALIAYTAVTSAIQIAGGPCYDVNKDVFVYGDDIIVKNEYAHIAISALESVGLLVNKGKSFINSRFTESCGQDTLDQSSVKPIRKKKLNEPLKRVKHRGKWVFDGGNGFIAHYVSLLNKARSLKYYNLSESLLHLVESAVGELPYGHTDSGYLCKEVDPSDVYLFNQAAGYEVNGKLRVICVVDKVLKTDLNGYPRLRRGLHEGGQVNPVADVFSGKGAKPLDPQQFGARSTVLQHKVLRKWGLGYA